MQQEEQDASRQRAKEGEEIGGYLAAELEQTTCPICYELMKAPKNTPTLLFPCGHTFCIECLTVSPSPDSSGSVGLRWPPWIKSRQHCAQHRSFRRRTKKRTGTHARIAASRLHLRCSSPPPSFAACMRRRLQVWLTLMSATGPKHAPPAANRRFHTEEGVCHPLFPNAPCPAPPCKAIVKPCHGIVLVPHSRR